MSSQLAFANYASPIAAAADFNPTPLVWAEVTRAPLQGGPQTDNLPIGENPIVFAGQRGALYADDLLYRIHVSPLSFTLGNIAGTTTRTFSIWNATSFDALLLSIAPTNAEGIGISGQSAPPLLYGPMQDRSYTITVTPEGPPAIGASWLLSFSTGDARTITMIGSRAVPWLWQPNWTPVISERLEWLTDVLRSFNGKEQRRRLRQGARRTIELQTLMVDNDRQRLEAAAFGWGARSWAMPLWWDGQPIAAPLSAGATSIAVSTVNREFIVGNYAIISNGNRNAEIVEVASFTASTVTFSRPVSAAWPAGSVFYPAVIMQMDPSIRVERFNPDASIVSARFSAVLPADVAAGVLPLYLGYPVLDAPALLAGSVTASYERKLEDFDNATGYPFRDDESGIPALTVAYGWHAVTRAQKASVRALLYLLAGKAGAVWISTRSRDMRVVADLALNATQINIENQKISIYQATSPGRNHIRIERRNGVVSYHKITGASEFSDTVEQITITPSIGPALLAADVQSVSFMTLYRQSADAVEIGHFTGESFEVRTQFTGFRHDL